MAIRLEDIIPQLYEVGVNTDENVVIGGNLTVSGTTTIAAVSQTDLTTTGNTILGNAVSDTTAINGATTITTTSASGLTVGRQGATAPVLKLNAATASVATGIEITGAAAASGVAIAAISSGTNENLTLDAKGSGTITIAGTSTGAIALGTATGITGAATVTSAGASALAVGLAGATNPALQVDASTASSATGIKVKSAAAGGGVAVSVVSSGTDEALTIDAKGTGTIGIGATSTGAVTITPATTITGLITATGGLTSVADIILESGTAVPATSGAVAAGAPITLYSTGIVIEVTSDAPTHARPKGSICINTGGSSTSTRMYVNTDGSTGWASFTTAS